MPFPFFLPPIFPPTLPDYPPPPPPLPPPPLPPPVDSAPPPCKFVPPPFDPGPTTMLGQLFKNPGMLFDTHYAKQFYADKAATASDSGNQALATTYDYIGGYIGGEAASVGQANAQVVLGVATMFVPPLQVVRGASSAAVNLLEGNAGAAALDVGSIFLGGHLKAQQVRHMQTSVSATNHFYRSLLVTHTSQAGAFAKLSYTRSILSQQFKVAGQALDAFGAAQIGWGRASFTEPAAATVAPQVGGVLFDQAVSARDVGELVGAYWDRERQELVVITLGDGPRERRLAVSDVDLLRACLRAAVAGQPLGVSIDPPADLRERGGRLPEGTPMLVSYLGLSEGTRAGAVMFEADRILKCLSRAEDNVTGLPLHVDVPGYQPLIVRWAERCEMGNAWHRFWFVIDQVEIRRDPDGDALAFGTTRLRTLTETELAGSPTATPDTAAADFAAHLSEHFDDYARALPVLARLRDLARWASLARLLVDDSSLELDLGDLFSTPPQRVDTPDSTPGSTVSRSRETGAGATRVVSSFGGVNLDGKPTILTDDGTARGLRGSAQEHQGSRGNHWVFPTSAGLRTATRIPLGRAAGGRGRVAVDHYLPSPTSTGLSFGILRRTGAVGEFGLGWTFGFPVELTRIDAGGKRKEVRTKRDQDDRSAPSLVLHDRRTGESGLFVSSDGHGWCRVLSQEASSDGGRTLRLDPADRIIERDGGFVRDRDGLVHAFDVDGRLLETRDSAGGRTTYSYRDELLISIADERGRRYELRHDEAGRILAILCPDGTRLRYEYDTRGRLRRQASSRGTGLVYTYDEANRIVEVRDLEGAVVERAHFASDGTQVALPQQGVDRVQAGNHLLRRRFAHGRLQEILDDEGNTVHIREQADGCLELSARDGEAALVLEYGPAGDLQRVGHGDEEVRFAHDEQGQLRSVRGGSGWALTLSAAGDVDVARDDLGREWEFRRDDSGTLESVHGSDGDVLRIDSVAGIPLAVRGARGSLRLRPRRRTLTARVTDQDGHVREHVFDRAGRLVKTREQGARPTRYRYDAHGRLKDVRTPAGAVRFEHDAEAASCTIRW